MSAYNNVFLLLFLILLLIKKIPPKISLNTLIIIIKLNIKKNCVEWSSKWGISLICKRKRGNKFLWKWDTIDSAQKPQPTTLFASFADSHFVLFYKFFYPFTLHITYDFHFKNEITTEILTYCHMRVLLKIFFTTFKIFIHTVEKERERTKL